MSILSADKFLNQVCNADCIEFMKQLPDRCVRLCFCDPPYNNNTLYNSYQDNKTPEEYLQWCKDWFAQCRRIADRVIVTPGHGNFWMWGNQIEKPWGVGAWYKPGNPASSVLGWCCWEPWLYYCHDYKALGGEDTIRATVSRQKGVGSHPCPKSLQLLLELIKKTTKEGEIVLDPFAGSGTTLLAAKILKRRFIGIEIDPSYVDSTRQRLADDVDLFDKS